MKHWNRTLLFAMALAVTAATGTGHAAAFTLVVGTNSADSVWVGITTRPSGASCTNVPDGGSCPSGVQNYVCRRASSSPGATAQWYYIGSAFGGLWVGYKLQASYGDDYMRVWMGVGNLAAGDTCRGSTSWNSPTYNGNYLDLAGNEGDDFLLGGDVDTWLWGDADDDTLYGFTAGGQVRGHGGNDNLYGFASSMGYVGDGENDCVYSSGGMGATYSMDPDTDLWGHNSACPAGAGFNNYLTAGWCGDYVVENVEECP